MPLLTHEDLFYISLVTHGITLAGGFIIGFFAGLGAKLWTKYSNLQIETFKDED